MFLSSLLTWAGKSFHQFDEVNECDPNQQQIIGNSLEVLFRKREPLPGSHDLYSFENKLMSAAAAASADVTVVGLGLIYGGKGYDFEDIFRANLELRGRQLVKRPAGWSMLGGDNKVPMIHYKDLAELIMKAVGGKLTGQQFLPASDCSNLTLNTIIEAVLSYVNDGLVSASEGIECASQDEILQSVLDDTSSLPKPLIWSSDLSFSSNFVQSRIGTDIKGVGGQGLLDSLGVYDEFISGHCACVIIFVAGNPQCGKNAVAKSIEETFKCLYVDIPSAVTFALRNPTQENSVGKRVEERDHVNCGSKSR